MFRKILVFVGFVLVMCGATNQSFSQSEEPDKLGFEPAHVSLYSYIRSGYMIEAGIMASDRPVVQSGLTLEWSNGVWFDLWHSTGIGGQDGGFDGGFDDEIDLTAAWSGSLDDFDLTVGLFYFDMYQIDQIGGIDFIVLFAEISRSFEVDDDNSLTPYLKFENFWTLDGETRGDSNVFLGLRHGWQVFDDWSINHSATAIYDTGMLGGNEGFSFSYRASLNWQVGKATVAPFELRLNTPISNFPNRETETTFGAGVTFRFK